MPNETGAFVKPGPTLLSRFRTLQAALLLSVVGACSSALAPAGTGGAGAAGTAGATGTAGTSGTGGTEGTGTCSDAPPSDPRFGCLPTYAEESAAHCQHAGSCGSFYATALATQHDSRLCVYDAQGALIWASRCEDDDAYCGNHCLTSAGGPSPAPACGELPNACDAASAAPGD